LSIPDDLSTIHFYLCSFKAEWIMSIKTTDITKYYDTQLVLDKINIEVKKGEVVGLLGPNGAGNHAVSSSPVS
jgi:ABC-type transporter Mla maintaining outer membrane lipid asymmetry ATPase subunit MlaF